MYGVVLMVHSLLRWLVLIVLAARALRGAQAGISGEVYGALDRRLSLAAIVLVDLQVLLGFALYFGLSPKAAAALADFGAAMKDPVLRFWAVEHLTSMLLALVAIHVGHAVGKRAATPAAGHRAGAIGAGLALALVLAGIPWAFRGL